MSYEVIARKWRPQTFEQLVGQPHISRTILNSIKNDRLHHALLFTGPRGTGKTSSARILAKILKCPNVTEATPCNQCTTCDEIAQGRNIDVIEIDGASNNGVDAIRELREGVSFLPSQGKYKIYILDEVHMLSTGAFNALLKTLEEPPAHVLFVLATTEVNKIPVTILSRVQRFDFRRISTKQIVEHLKNICAKDSVDIDTESLWTIARQGDGSMRDSQSLLDQVITFAGQKITPQLAVDILGLTDRALVLETLTALCARNLSDTMACIEKLRESGFDPIIFGKELIESIRNAIFLKVSKNPTSLDLPDSEIRYLTDLGEPLQYEDLHLIFDMILKGISDLTRSVDPILVMEILLLRCAQAPNVVQISELLSARPQGTVTQSQDSVARPAAPAMATHKSNPIGINPQEKWFQFVQQVKAADPILGAKIENLIFINHKDNKLELGIPAKVSFLSPQFQDKALLSDLGKHVHIEYGAGCEFTITESKQSSVKVATTAKSLATEKENAKTQEVIEDLSKHPLVRSASQAFKVKIKSVTNKGDHK